MAALAGRDMRLKYSSTAIAGARTDSITVNQSMIDITDKDDDGLRTLLDDIGVKSMSASVAGVLKGRTLIDLCNGDEATNLHTMEVEIVGIGTYAGSWFITQFEVQGEDGDNPATFSCNLESSGAITWTDAA